MINEKISLCCITGNCEDIISRFIDTFRPLVDEIVIVRAIGNQKHDGTLRKALAAGCKVGEYFNHNNGDWPHVDNFSAARNVAWEMGSHEWLMWADIDDSIDEVSIKEFRRLVREAPANIDMIQCPYVVPDQGIFENMRERLMRRGKFVWTMPIHECVKSATPDKHECIQTKKAKITHAAKSDRRVSCERNIRILEAIPESERGAGTYFYLFSEYHGLGRKTDAINAANKFIKLPDAGPVEKYECLLILSTLSEEPDKMSAMLHGAHQIAPDRREALFELANLEMTFGNVERSRAYCRQMMALPRPAAGAWNLRQKFYGWAARDLETNVERFAGREAKANALDYNRFKAAGGKISLLHATRGRPIQACRARLTWIDTATNPDAIEHIFAIDSDDVHSQCLRRFKHVIVEGKGGCVEAWNVAAYHANGDIFIQVSDDWVPPWGWDQLIIDRLGDLSQPKVLAISDGHRKDDLLCMAILTRARWEQQSKTLFHPDFKGVFSDNWFSYRAFEDGVVIDAKDLEFVHCHPLFGTAQNDETYATQNSPERYASGEKIFNQLIKAKGRIIRTNCCVRLGDNLIHLQWLRKLARRYPETEFIHSTADCYLPQLREVVSDLGNITLTDKPEGETLEVWKNHQDFWINHPLKNDWCSFYVVWFDELARRMGLENPIREPEQFLFDYPGLIRRTKLDGPFDFLIINSQPLSGQLRSSSDLSGVVSELSNKWGRIITTAPIKLPDADFPCTQDFHMSVTDIGALSRHCRFIIMNSTGPSWPTFNIYNKDSVELRIILLDNEKLNMSPNTIHVQNERQVLDVLKEKKLL